MNWYLAKMVFQIICGEGQHTPQFDEQLRLIAAGSKQEAILKAREIGFQEQEVIDNPDHQRVEWKFINTAELYKLNGWIDGAELYSRVHETEEADSYIALTHQKAEDIESGQTHELLKLL